MTLWKRKKEEPPKPQEPQKPIPIGPQALEIMRSEASRALSGPQTGTRSFDMDDLLAIVGEKRGPYDDLQPVVAIRVRQRYAASLMGAALGEKTRKSYDLLKTEFTRDKASNYEHEAREHDKEDRHQEALQAIERALMCDDSKFALWKTAGDYAVRARNTQKARKYYSIVATLPQVRGGFETINKSDREVVEAAIRALQAF